MRSLLAPLIACILFVSTLTGRGQNFDLESERADIAYTRLRTSIINRFIHDSPGTFSHITPGMKPEINPRRKVIALTLDACGGEHGNAYDSAFINYLRRRGVPATLFLSGRWIDANFETVKTLAGDTLFEIENHGLDHKPCSFTSEEIFGIRGTKNVGEIVDEIELNARKIKSITGTKPIFYRSATAYADSECAVIAHILDERLISYTDLSGDAEPGLTSDAIARNIITNAANGAIIIMHLNHPGRNGREGFMKAFEILTERGYVFVKLNEFSFVD